jgi:hypothetical protein
MTIRPSDAYLMYTTNRTSQLSQITYRGAIALPPPRVAVASS